MNRVQVLFTKHENISSWVIRAATMSPWSHVAVPHGDYLVESVAFHGVRAAKIQDTLRLADSYVFAEIKTPLTQAQVFSACLSQVGKDYDYGAVLGMPFGRDWQEDDKWFCSELTEWGFVVNGAPNFSTDKMHRVTPRDIWMLTR